MDNLIRYLKQRVPSKYIEIPNEISELSNQELFINSLSKDIDLNPAYFKPIFKKILTRQEQENFDILDDFYSTYIEKLISALELSAMDFDYLTYEVIPGKSIVLKENPKLISGLNTTGLRTWELSIYLSYFLLNHYFLKHPEYQNVLELGTGTGLVGLSLNKYSSNKVYMTDGTSQLIENLATNFQQNDIKINNCFQYIWGDDLQIDVDLCVGADITYDISILPTLIETFQKLFNVCKVKCVLIACTIRNEDTIAEFEKLLSIFNYNILQPVPVDTMFIQPSTKFKIFEIYSRV